MNIYIYISLQIKSHVGYLSYTFAVFYQNWLLNCHPPFLILLVVFVSKMANLPAALKITRLHQPFRHPS